MHDVQVETRSGTKVMVCQTAMRSAGALQKTVINERYTASGTLRLGLQMTWLKYACFHTLLQLVLFVEQALKGRCDVAEDPQPGH